MLEHGRPNSHI